MIMVRIDYPCLRVGRHKCNPTLTPIVKGSKFGNFQCPRNQYEVDLMKVVPYALSETCTRPNLAFVTRMPVDIRKILSNITGMELRKP
jgi:hypothetical protein